MTTPTDTSARGAMSPVPPNAPLVVAWNKYKVSDEYANAKNWATNENHTDGSLWAAFVQGWERRAADPRAAVADFDPVAMAMRNTESAVKLAEMEGHARYWKDMYLDLLEKQPIPAEYQKATQPEGPRPPVDDLPIASQILDKRTRERQVAEEERDHMKLRAEKAEARVAELREALSQLVATVRGESPALLNADSGGSPFLILMIEDALMDEQRAERPGARGEGKWIACSERMPEDGHIVIVSATCDCCATKWMCSAAWDAERGWDFDGDGDGGIGRWKVTHWMLLPPGPGEVGEMGAGT